MAVGLGVAGGKGVGDDVTGAGERLGVSTRDAVRAWLGVGVALNAALGVTLGTTVAQPTIENATTHATAIDRDIGN